MAEVCDRIKAVRLYMKMSGRAFGKEIGYKQATISTVENGKSPVTDKLIAGICAKFNVNERWLRTGEGDMFADTLDEARKVELAAAFIRSILNDLSEANKRIVWETIKTLQAQGVLVTDDKKKKTN